MFRIAKVFVALAIVLSLHGAPGVANAQRIRTEAGAMAHQCALPVRYRLYEMPATDLTATKAALALWNKTVGFALFQEARYEEDVGLHIGAVEADGLGDPNHLAATQMLFGDQGCVKIAAIAIPKTRLDGYSPAGRVWVIAHELGHVLGLDHMLTDEVNLMYPTARPAPKARPVLECDQRRALAASIPLDLSMCE